MALLIETPDEQLANDIEEDVQRGRLDLTKHAIRRDRLLGHTNLFDTLLLPLVAVLLRWPMRLWG